jgi:tetratricopeptide (TPR) repeat protein
MISVEGFAVILDFGIARSSSSATAATGIVGTLDYMAPEQAEGGAVDQRADIYAFGLIVREMLVGPRKRIVPNDPMADLKARIEQGLPRIRSLNNQIPEAVDDLVAKCLARDPAARYQTSTELVAALNRLDEFGILIREPRRLTWRHVTATAIVVLAMLSSTYFVTRRATLPAEQHAPVSVVIADLQNLTHDASLDRTLEPILKLSLEDAGFISAYDRSGISRTLGVQPPEALDERAALEIALKQGLGVVISGSLERQGSAYGITVKATEAVTGTVVAKTSDRASSKAEIVGVVASLASTIRRALGDDRSEAAQRFATQTFSATSLDVVRQYAAAAEALSKSKFEDALQNFSKAVAADKNFGLAYAGMAIASRNLDRQQDAEKYIKAAVGHLDTMTERERYRTRGLFYFITTDYPACVKEYSDLITRYAADAAARNNLALCLTYLRQMPRAVEEMQQVLKILPNRTLYRVNLALYAAYSGDSPTAEREARAVKPPELFGSVALAFSKLLQGQLPQASDTYATLGTIGGQGASYMASGLGDLAMYQGRFADAAQMFSRGAASDLASKDTDRAASKFAALASAEVLRQRKPAAIAAIEKALVSSRTVKIRFLAARVFVEAGAVARAQTLAAALGAELLAEPQAYGKIIEGEIALNNGDARQAIKHLTEAGTLLDTWIGHFDLARAYLAAGAFTQADSEIDRCIARRGEALSLFLDEEPTYRYFPPVYYYQGRVREGLGNAGFAESYRAYLALRGDSKEDAMLTDVRHRIASR